MAAIIDFARAGDERAFVAALHRPPRLTARWQLDTRGRLVCVWQAVPPSGGADATRDSARHRAA